MFDRPSNMGIKKYLKVNASCIAIIVFLLIYPSLTIAQESLEYQVKAAFVHKFIKFTKWPLSAFESNNSPLVIGIMGESPIWSGLKDLENKPVMGRKLKIVKVNKPDLEQKCHIIFFSKTKIRKAKKLLQKIDKLKILTIGESDWFSENGGMINFIIVRGKLRFEINVAAVNRSGLKLSSKLLRLGKIIETN
jgi:hypothetical protein